MFTLKNILRLNAISCLTFGTLLYLFPDSIALFLSNSEPAPAMALFTIGIVLIVNGCHLMWASNHPIPTKSLILYFSAGDFLWVITSIALMVTDYWVSTLLGDAVVLSISICVLFFGVSQMKARKAMGHC